MQTLHPFRGSIQEYLEAISDPDRYRPNGCPLCQAAHPLRAHGFYHRTLVEVVKVVLVAKDRLPVRRYLCLLCKRTVSLLPEFALPYLRFGVLLISLFLTARLLERRTLGQAARAAHQPDMPYQRGQFWVRRFHGQARAISTALASLTEVVPASDLVTRALQMLQAVGWIASHRFLFGQLRMHMLDWPRFLVPHGFHLGLSPASPGS